MMTEQDIKDIINAVYRKQLYPLEQNGSREPLVDHYSKALHQKIKRIIKAVRDDYKERLAKKERMLK